MFLAGGQLGQHDRQPHHDPVKSDEGGFIVPKSKGMINGPSQHYKSLWMKCECISYRFIQCLDMFMSLTINVTYVYAHI